MIIIGITGTLGAGKGTVVAYLVKEKGFVHYSVRDYLTAIITQKGIEVNRDILTHTANEIRLKNSPGYIIQQMYQKAISQNKNCIIESIRAPAEIDILREHKGFYLLAVDGDIRIRYDRVKKRGSATDNIDFETFQRNETREMNSDNPNHQNLSACIRKANFIIFNNGNIRELQESIDSILQKIGIIT